MTKRRFALTLLFCLLSSPGFAQVDTPMNAFNCSGTVGTTAAQITFPQSGGTGPTAATSWVFIVNPSAAASLWMNIAGGTAANNSAGSFPLANTGSNVVLTNPPPAAISIIASSASTPYTCYYR